jgi:hypothetical protein
VLQRGSPEPSQWVWCLGTHGGAGAHLGWEAGFKVVGHMAASDLTSAGRLDPMPRDTWWHVVAHPALCLDVKLVHRVPDLQDTDNVCYYLSKTTTVTIWHLENIDR